MKIRLTLLSLFLCSCHILQAGGRWSSRLYLKQPGNPAECHVLHADACDASRLYATGPLPLEIRRDTVREEAGLRIVLTLKASEMCYYNIEQVIVSDCSESEALYYMPGFWYQRNQRSPAEAPSMQVSNSWQVRCDRLSTPLTGIFDPSSGRYQTIMRTDDCVCDALACHAYGEVILSGPTSVGFTGFCSVEGCSALCFGYPWSESSYTYLRKLTLAPAVRAFDKLEQGQTRTLSWLLCEGSAQGFSDFVEQTWNRSFDFWSPEPIATTFKPSEAKACLAQYFRQSYVDRYPLKYTSGVELRIDDPKPNGIAEVGFVGRVLLNAFNALEYGEATHDATLVAQARSVFDSYLVHGFTSGGLIREFVDFERGKEPDVYTIRRQSEGLYALWCYLHYEETRGRSHPEWEVRIRTLLTRLLTLQQPDGSFPRKFRDDLQVVDAAGGSTPSATLPLAMAYRQFGQKIYRDAARRTADYLDHNLIAKADYFSSTLDANCEDKEASLYAATAMYYMTRITRGEERRRYADLCRQAAYFALSWYYLWDVPFAQGQMLGDAGFRSRGWGNVSVENNHVDVFVFEFATVLDFLAKEYGEERFARMARVMRTSMLQLMPTAENHCNIGRVGYYPEVVQHTTWDYGHNGKGFYNDIFAPGWTVASLWQLLTPERVDDFFNR